MRTIYFTTSSFTYVYDHQVNKDVTNISWRYLSIQLVRDFAVSSILKVASLRMMKMLLQFLCMVCRDKH